MRVKDITKQQAVIDATIQVVNEIGFASASISKIAKRAGVSVATIYIYHTDKNDLMVNTYYEVKKTLSAFSYNGMDLDSNDIQAQFRILWQNLLKAGSIHPTMVSYAEQFSNAPYADMVDKDRIMVFAAPLLDLIQRGKREKVLKNITIETFMAFFVAPANYLGNRKLCAGFDVTETNIQEAFDLAWAAISTLD